MMSMLVYRGFQVAYFLATAVFLANALSWGIEGRPAVFHQAWFWITTPLWIKWTWWWIGEAIWAFAKDKERWGRLSSLQPLALFALRILTPGLWLATTALLLPLYLVWYSTGYAGRVRHGRVEPNGIEADLKNIDSPLHLWKLMNDDGR